MGFVGVSVLKGMGDNMEFFVKCNPPKTTMQSATRIFKTKDGRMFIGKTDKAKSVREELMALFMKYVPNKPLEKPLQVTVEWGYPYLKTVRKKDIGKIIPCGTRSDCDNLAKGWCDIMTRLGFWKDDALIWDLRFRKFYTDRPGIGVKIEETEDFL